MIRCCYTVMCLFLYQNILKSVKKKWQDAIRWHTLGSVKMGVLGAALYIADYIEPLEVIS